MIEQKKFPAWYRQPRLLLGGLLLTVLSLPIRADFFTISTGDPPLTIPGPSNPATTFPDFSVLSPYTYVSSGPRATININSGPIVGEILLGNGARLTGSGNNVCSSTVGTCNSTNGTPLQIDVSNGIVSSNPANPTPTFTPVAASVGVDAFNQAAALSAFAASLMPDLTVSSLPTGTANPVVGNGGLNVINITGNQSGPINFQGTANDIFVINLFANLSNNNPMVLNGVLPSNILWNFVGTATGNRFSTAGGGAQFGTFLATNQSGNVNFQFSNLNLVGALWNTSGNIQNVSGSMTRVFAPFNPPAPPAVPDGGMTLMLLGGALVGLESLRRRLRV